MLVDRNRSKVERQVIDYLNGGWYLQMEMEKEVQRGTLQVGVLGLQENKKRSLFRRK